MVERRILAEDAEMILPDTEELEILKKELKEVAIFQFGGLKTEEQFTAFMQRIPSLKIGAIQRDAFIELFDYITEGRFFTGTGENEGKIGFDPYVQSLEESGLSIEENISKNFNDLERYMDDRRYMRWVARQEESMGIDPRDGDVFYQLDADIPAIMGKYFPNKKIEYIDAR